MHGPASPPPPPINVEKLLAAVRRAALAAPVTALDDWWINVRCSDCGGLTSYPLRLLAQRHSTRALAQTVNRLRCKRCGGLPVSVQLTDDPQSGSHGGPPPSWRVELLSANEDKPSR